MREQKLQQQASEQQVATSGNSKWSARALARRHCASPRARLRHGEYLISICDQIARASSRAPKAARLEFGALDERIITTRALRTLAACRLPLASRLHIASAFRINSSARSLKRVCAHSLDLLFSIAKMFPQRPATFMLANSRANVCFHPQSIMYVLFYCFLLLLFCLQKALKS